MPSRFVAALVLLFALNQCAAGADSPSDLIIGTWQDRAEKTDAVITFAKGGTGAITEFTPNGPNQAGITWTMTGVYGNGGIVVINYNDADKAGPFTWLFVFNGKDTFVTQPNQNKIVFMGRQK